MKFFYHIDNSWWITINWFCYW